MLHLTSGTVPRVVAGHSVLEAGKHVEVWFEDMDAALAKGPIVSVGSEPAPHLVIKSGNTVSAVFLSPGVRVDLDFKAYS